MGLCSRHCGAESLICDGMTSAGHRIGGSKWKSPWEMRRTPACPPGRVYFPARSAPGWATAPLPGELHSGFTGGSRAALTPPPLKATMFGNTWRLGERIHVRN